MQLHCRKLLTIVTEAALENTLIHDFERLGAHGYTITDARGSGSRGVRNGGWDASANIRIEIICEAAVADAIAIYLKDHYYDDFAMVLFCHDVDVLRVDKF
jgi:hypothetical protein